MIPDGDRRHDSESGGIVDQIEFLLVGHKKDVMAEFVLGNHVLHSQWGHMARKPVQDMPDRALGSQIRFQAGEFSGFELCSILDPDVIVHDRAPERNARQDPLRPAPSSSYPLSQSTAMSLASARAGGQQNSRPGIASTITAKGFQSCDWIRIKQSQENHSVEA